MARTHCQLEGDEIVIRFHTKRLFRRFRKSSARSYGIKMKDSRRFIELIIEEISKARRPHLFPTTSAIDEMLDDVIESLLSKMGAGYPEKQTNCFKWDDENETDK
ncbi:hypothetical protein G8759_31210 [Spirosoma aureum]|uniref:Uncharacterized protein n=1 Tax=Spirosoma aureum TaxID=2692134 RepID=A0A6G9AX66_9BACT|nr:hypothetical protein [Spirosoma aureum]QIP16793.1 hypothetical protein G8759_31210 [Spirosoma aureum]